MHGRGHSLSVQHQRVRDNDRSRAFGISFRTGKTREEYPRTTSPALAYLGLKPILVDSQALDLPSRVESGMPSLAAAPAGPDIRPRLSASAASITSFSCA